MKYFFCLFISIFVISCNSSMNCGYSDGPFQSKIVSIPFESIGLEDVTYDDNCKIFVNNRDTSSCPIMTFVENESILFSLEMDISDSEDGANLILSEISDLIVDKNSKNMLKLTFSCYWSYGHEGGTMKINKKTGKNNFCLSW